MGTDLISSEKVALIELVKNAYDADASVVLIRFEAPLVAGDGSVQIWDDGHGMDVDTLQISWLDIATDVKKKRTRSEGGRRRVLGEKGIGRLASARLATEMLVTTRRPDADEVNLLIDWRDFDRADAYLDEIEVAWQVSSPTVFTTDGASTLTFEAAGVQRWQPGQGTVLQLDHLTKTWEDSDFEDLATALSRLIRPRPDLPSREVIDEFRVVLDLPDPYEAFAGEIGPPDELRNPLYKLTGDVDAQGVSQLHYSQLDPPAELDLLDHRLWTSTARPPQCGPFSLDIEVWDRDRDTIEKLSGQSVPAFRKLLDQVAGVSVYRDGFRVLPFGEAGDDWLALDRRRIQNPTMRVSNNQLIGHVFIDSDANSELRDQSNREGLLDGVPYEDLRQLVGAALTVLETRRFGARRPAKRPKDNRGGLFRRFDLGEVQAALAAAYPNDRRLIGLVNAKDLEIRAGVEEVQQVLAQYSRLATLGSLVDRVVHDGRTAVGYLRNLVRFGQRDFAKSALSAEQKLEIASRSMREVAVQADLLSTLFRQIEPFSGRRRGKPRVLPLRQMIDDAVSMLAFETDEAGVGVTVVGEGVDVRVDASEIISVVVNLIRNSVYWLSTMPAELPRKVQIDLSRLAEDEVLVQVSDSGPGVSEDVRELIFDPYFSERPDGVGLGLSIAGNIVEEFYDGTLRLLDQGPLPGATFAATFRKRV